MTTPEPESRPATEPVGHAASSQKRRSGLFWGVAGAVILAVIGLVIYLVSGPSKGAVDQATDAVCSSVQQAVKGVGRAHARKVSGNPAARRAQSVERRQAFELGGSYLATTLDMYPATPGELSAEVRKLAYSYRLRAMNSLTGVGGDAAKPAIAMSKDATAAIREYCTQRAESSEGESAPEGDGS